MTFITAYYQFSSYYILNFDILFQILALISIIDWSTILILTTFPVRYLYQCYIINMKQRLYLLSLFSKKISMNKTFFPKYFM